MGHDLHELKKILEDRIRILDIRIDDIQTTQNLLVHINTSIYRELNRLIQFIKSRISASALAIIWKDNMASPNLNPGQKCSFTVVPVTSSGTASSATLSNLQFSSSDTTVFTVVPDPNNPNGGIVTAGNPATLPDSASLTVTATATEPDGVTAESLSGSDSVQVVAVQPPPPPPPVATGLSISWGTPQ